MVRQQTVEVFHALMKKGWIDRDENNLIWGYIEDPQVQEDLEAFKAVLGIDLHRVRDRWYMIPTQENDLFLKNNVDYKRDIKADNTVRNRDLYLMNYLSIYLIYTFFRGEGSNPLCRDFIQKEDFIVLFTEHCKGVEVKSVEDNEESTDYNDNFRQLAIAWLSKPDGELTSQKFDTKYGILNRILRKYAEDDLFDATTEGLIRPTRKMQDLMPYFLRKERVAEIQNWLKEDDYATNN